MLNEPTLEKLQSLRFDGMAAAWSEQQQKHGDLASLSFDERFGLLVDAEWLHRQNKRLSRYLAEAKLRLSQACIEDITTRLAASSTKPRSALWPPAAGSRSATT